MTNIKFCCKEIVLFFSRHVLRFHVNGPLGYHVHLCSSVEFTFGDEEKVMGKLTEEGHEV